MGQGADFGPASGMGQGADSGQISELSHGGVTKGLFRIDQGYIVPRARIYKLLKSMELVGPDGLESLTKGL